VTLPGMKARFSQALLASAVPAVIGYQKCVRDLGTETRMVRAKL
jgi:hypothetical protein